MKKRRRKKHSLYAANRKPNTHTRCYTTRFIPLCLVSNTQTASHIQTCVETVIAVSLDEDGCERGRGYRINPPRNRQRGNLDDEKLLHVLARTALAHTVPHRVRENTGCSPHDGYGGFGASYQNRQHTFLDVYAVMFALFVTWVDSACVRKSM